MAKGPLAVAAAFLRRMASEEVSDGDLVWAFHADSDQEAFASLVERHGPLVWSVCQRVLGNKHDAEDAFQATFLVLARKAGSIRRQESIGSWLYGVAYRTAVRTRCQAAQRHSHERHAADMPKVHGYDAEIWQELQPVLDAELNELPRKYRDPIVLCHLQEKSREEVARQLGCQLGTLKSRLSRGLDKLRARLLRRGVEISTCTLGALLIENASAGSAAMPTYLARSTAKSAAWFAAGKGAALGTIPASVTAVAESVSKLLLLSKLAKIAAVALVAVAALVAIGIVGGHLPHGVEPAARANAGEPRPVAPDTKLDQLANDVAALRSEIRSNPPIDPPTLPRKEISPAMRDLSNARVEALVKSIFDLEDSITAGNRQGAAAKLKAQVLHAELASARQELDRRMNALPDQVSRAVKKYQAKMSDLREARQRALEGRYVRGVNKKLKRAEKAKMMIWAAEVRAGTLPEADARNWMVRDDIDQPKARVLRDRNAK